MEMTGERRIAAPRTVVWDALNNPEILKASIPGCESIEMTGDNQLTAKVALKIGPVSARFGGKVELLDLDPPNGYRIQGEGQGGVAGFAKGGATVKLAEDGPGATLMTYDVKAQVGGKMAQLGARLIDSTAKSMADQFFDRFSAQVAPAPAAPAITEAGAPAPAASTAPSSLPAIGGFQIPSEIMGLPLVAWIGIGITAVILVLLFGSYL